MKHLADRRESTLFIHETEQVASNRAIREVIRQTQGWHIGRQIAMETNKSWNKTSTLTVLGLTGITTVLRQRQQSRILTVCHHHSYYSYCVSVIFMPSIWRMSQKNNNKMNNKLTDSKRLNYVISSIRIQIFLSIHPSFLPSIFCLCGVSKNVPSKVLSAPTVLLNEYPIWIHSHLSVWPLNFICFDSCSGLNSQARLHKTA